MKKLYARLVLALIRPALEEHQRSTLQQAMNSSGRLSDESLEDELRRRGRIEPDIAAAQGARATVVSDLRVSLDPEELQKLIDAAWARTKDEILQSMARGGPFSSLAPRVPSGELPGRSPDSWPPASSEGRAHPEAASEPRTTLYGRCCIATSDAKPGETVLVQGKSPRFDPRPAVE